MRLIKIIGCGFLIIGIVIFMRPSKTMNTNNEIYTLNSKIEICKMNIKKNRDIINMYAEKKESQEREIRNDYTLSYEEKLFSLSILDAVYETKVEDYYDEIAVTNKEIAGYESEIETLNKKPGPTQYMGVVIVLISIILFIISFTYKPHKVQSQEELL